MERFFGSSKVFVQVSVGVYAESFQVAAKFVVATFSVVPDMRALGSVHGIEDAAVRGWLVSEVSRVESFFDEGDLFFAMVFHIAIHFRSREKIDNTAVCHKSFEPRRLHESFNLLNVCSPFRK